MNIKELQERLSAHPNGSAIRAELSKKRGQHLLLSGLFGSMRASVLAAVGRPMIIVAEDEDEAMYLKSDLNALGAEAMLFPTSHRRRQSKDEAYVLARTETLSALSAGKPILVVTYAEAMAEPVPAPKTLSARSVAVATGEKVQISALQEILMQLGFEREDFVFEPGQYAIRGGIVDIYSYNHDDPYRLDFWGDEVDSIRTFDIENQLSKTRIEGGITIVGAGAENETADMGCITDYLSEDTVWVSRDWQVVNYRMNGLANPLPPIADRHTIEMGAKSTYFPQSSVIRFETETQPAFKKQFDLLEEDLRRKVADGYTIYIAAEQKKQLDRLESILQSLQDPMYATGEQASSPISFIPVLGAIHEGWSDRHEKIAVYTDHQIFERYHRVMQQSENARRGKAIVTLREINQLQLGDYVVHQDHGIGQFGGLVTTTANGKRQEMIRINFREGDYIFVSIHNLHRISKYKGKEGSAPTVSRLGSGAWERLKERTKDKVKDIARDLIRLYATRKQQAGHACLPDGYMQQELEASFLYEDTPDQAKATIDVKRDLESPQPMDRLICGDVGFGKTEIAMRAAFKVATDGRQVAVLVPTTVLALQHYNTFCERFKNFPVTIEYLSRAKTVRETKDISERLKAGQIDILVGTHKIVGKAVEWKDLGLLIIDEEQKFGVAVKEKLKSLRTNVDVLTLTATPIPRTLQFSLLGARDLSVMTTPPPNRYPVQTELITMDDEDILREAIHLEMGRNGQVFVVNNRIDMLPRIADRIQRLCPEARIATAHGQMPPGEMEQRLEDFINYEFDVLVSTTIIESGIDIPNVNTIIIYSAQHYGLSDLHQLRGRVGRSNRKAYCYLVAPEKSLLTADARRRLEALEVFSELGSGFNLAMQDLDIRGAGNMLGAEQSGFIADLGYETYQKILNEAVEEIRDEMKEAGLNPQEESYADESKTDDYTAREPGRLWVKDCQLETDINLCLPAEYVENISERIALYRELDQIRSNEELAEYEKRLIDRFGPLPAEAKELMRVVQLRWLCGRLGIERIYLKSERLTMYFPMKNDRYYQSREFSQILEYIYSRPTRCAVKEETDKKGVKTGKRYATVMNVRTIEGAITLLSKIMEL